MKRTLLNGQNGSFQITFAERPGVEFRISEKEIGRGASCIVYHAVGSDNIEHLLKEYYPKHLELIRDDSGRILVPEDKQEAFEQGLDRFRAGCERQKSIRLSNEGLKNFTCNVQGYYAANGTEYIDMTCFNGQTYDHVQEKSVYNLMLRMRTLAQVVGNYHNHEPEGLLHLDIKPENIYVRPENETIEDVMLFDFDSVTPVSDVYTAKALSCTKTWAAPEQLLPEKRRNICPATDLFAIGEIIFVQLFGRHSTSAERRSFVTKYAYDHNADIFKDMNPKVFPLLDDLLCHTICGVVGRRYQSAEELIAKLDEIIKIANPEAPYLKSSLPAVQNFFVGRENEIEEIHIKLSEARILFLRGIGGIGKSELAKHYAQEHKNDYDAIIFAPYVNNVSMLLQDDTAIPLYNFSQYPEEKPEEYCARKLRKLRELCDERTLFIVDNLDREDDPDLNKLLDLGCKLLITTRMDFSDYGYGQRLYLDALCDRNSILEIFHKHYTKPLTEEETACVEQIIDLVAGHTMTVELLAKQMMAGRVKPDKMLAKLQAGGISESGKEKVRSGKDGVLSAQSAYDHIRALFDLSELCEDERHILANLSLIPYTGISAEMFHDLCELKDNETVNQLVLEGWIRFDECIDVISLHPVVCDIARGLLTLNLSWSNAIYKNITCLWTSEDFYRLSASKRSPQIELFAYIADQAVRIKLQTAEVATYLSSDFWNEHAVGSLQNSYGRVERYYRAAVEIWSSFHSSNCIGLVEAYGNLGLLLAYSGDYQTAEDITCKAIAVIKQIPNADISLTGALYDNLGYILAEKGDWQRAENYHKEAIEVYTKICPIPQARVALVHNNLGSLYQSCDNFDAAEEHFKMGLNILLDVNGEYHSDTALLYNNLGCLYTEINKFSKAKEFYLKALAIRKKLFGEENASTADSYHGVGIIQLYLEEYESSEENLMRALEVRRRVFGPVSPKVANSHNVLGGLYDEQGRQCDAEKHYLFSLEIRKSLFGEEDAEVARSYNNLGAFYFDNRQYGQAEEYIKTALAIRQRLFGDDHSETAGSYYRLGLLYRYKGEMGAARASIEKGYNIYKKIFGDAHHKTLTMKATLSEL